MDPIVSLHRYFIWAGHFERSFQAAVLEKGAFAAHDTKSFFTDDRGLNMSYWYSSLFVTIEGYRELKLVDSVVDGLLASDNVALLRRYRNGVFHFQRDYFDDRFVNLMSNGQSIVGWVQDLHRELGRFLLAEVNRSARA